MGLDMYLHMRRNFSGYELPNNNTATYKQIIEASSFDGLADKGSPFVTVDTTIMYWRKANQIHGWFVNELAEGVDECQEIRVTRENLQTLRDLCFEALSIPAGKTLAEHASEVLPPTSGFFFGSEEIDDWYVQDLKETMDGLNRILSQLPEDGEDWDWSLYYQASW